MRCYGGCDFPVDPELDAIAATVLWTPAAAPAVSHVIGPPPPEALTNSTLQLGPLSPSQSIEQKGWRVLVGGIVTMSTAPEIGDHPVAVLIPLDAHWGVRLKAAERLRHAIQGQSPRRWFTKQRRIRISKALRTDDARHSGAALRDIATVYFGPERIAAEPWKTSALKAHTARLANYGKRLTSAGYRQLLRGQTASRTRSR